MSDWNFDPERYEGHTPGKWQFSHFNGTTRPAELFCVMDDDSEVDIATFEDWELDSYTEAEQLANARLISDAPYLLAYITELRERNEKLREYVSHYQDCVAGQFRRGEPTADRNYRTLYGYGGKAKWYLRGEKPPCTCGLDELLQEGA